MCWVTLTNQKLENISNNNKIDGSLILPHKTLENEPKLNVIYANMYTKYKKTLIHNFKSA